MEAHLKISVLFIFVVSLCADVTYWDDSIIRPYVHHSELQRRWAMSFMAPHLKSLNGDESILDVGCGDGKISADLSCFVPNGKVVGVDLAEPMIHWALRQFHPKDYPNLSFQLGSFLDPQLEETFDVIVSFCALQHTSDQSKSLESLFPYLKSNGKILILVPIRNNREWNQARLNIQNNEKWKPFYQGFPPRKMHTQEEYFQMAALAGFQNIEVLTHSTSDPFVDKKELVDWMIGTYPPMVPQNLIADFYNDWIEEYLRLRPDAITPEGVIYTYFGYFTLSATRG
jgi:trans-aconitate methyltransferase